MIVVQRGVVDITPEYNRALRPVFCVSEGDKTSRQIVITVMQNGEAFLIPSGSTVYIIGKKSDSTIFTYRCNYSGSDVSFDITEQMSAAGGIVLCELQINLSGQVLGSANFVYWTEPTPVENGTYSESDLNIMLEAIAGAERLDNFYAGIEDMVAQAVEQIQIMPGQVVIDPTLLVNGAAADAAATGNAVRSFLNALITESTAEATIATCDDAAGGLPLKKLTANIEPAQAGSGDPSPDNVRAISGYSAVSVYRTGKNLLDLNGHILASSNGLTFASDSTDKNAIRVSGTTTETWATISNSVIPCKLVSGKKYTFTIDTAGAYRAYIRRRNADGTTPTETTALGGTSITWTQTQDADAFISLALAGMTIGATINTTLRIMVAEGTDATYAPNEHATYPITFPTEAGTVYGGTLTVNSDGSGTLTVDKATTTVNGTTVKAEGVYGNGAFYTSPISDMYNDNSGSRQREVLVMCDKLNSVSYRTLSDTLPAYAISQNIGIRFVLNLPDISTISDANAWLAENPLTVVYILASPTTYALSAVQVVQMLQGVNNVWTDAAGTLTAEYYASTGLYVEKKVNAQRNMIAGVEEAMTATKNYSVNDLLIVGNTLYKVTAAVSSGAALVVGTNVTETTVAEQLIALANA